MRGVNLAQLPTRPSKKAWSVPKVAFRKDSMLGLMAVNWGTSLACSPISDGEGWGEAALTEPPAPQRAAATMARQSNPDTARGRRVRVCEKAAPIVDLLAVMGPSVVARLLGGRAVGKCRARPSQTTPLAARRARGSLRRLVSDPLLRWHSQTPKSVLTG